MSRVRRLDHVAIAVRDTGTAIAELGERLGLQVAGSEERSDPPVRLTYLDAGNCFIQLVEPLDGSAEIAQWLAANGEGLHHVCFGVDSVLDAVAAIGGTGPPDALGSGRGRPSAFVPEPVCGARIECTEFSHHLDVEQTTGWLPGPGYSARSRATS
ncbi:MAG TPA: VOC family protein [Solirubrobacteraceae bacterium]|nr:VOC family protein [Solirubrobacteraceae bacterium]